MYRTLRYSVVLLLAGVLVSSQPVVAQRAASYSDSEKDLKRLIENLQEAAAKNNIPRFRAAVEPLYLTGHETWFAETFGERLGAMVSGDYASRTSNFDFVTVMFAGFKKLAEGGYKKPEIQKLNEPCDANVLNNEYPALFARQKKVPLYSVRYRKGEKFLSFGFFAFVEGGFRYIGHLDFTKDPSDALRKPSIRVGGNVQRAKLLEKPNPTYPVRARQAHVQGTVRLKATIGLDGGVADLRLVSGHCWLAEASIEAVRKWRYQPTLLNGQPIEVITTIDVVFTLSN